MSSGRAPKSAWPDYDWQRASIVSELRKIPGEHLVIVRYSRCSARMVYNSADPTDFAPPLD